LIIAEDKTSVSELNLIATVPNKLQHNTT
jgi:hypothetical protein